MSLRLPGAVKRSQPMKADWQIRREVAFQAHHRAVFECRVCGLRQSPGFTRAQHQHRTLGRSIARPGACVHRFPQRRARPPAGAMPAQKALAMAYALNPTRKKLYEDKDLIAAQPFTAQLREVFESARPRRLRRITR